MFRIAIVERDEAVVGLLYRYIERFAGAEGVAFQTDRFADGMEFVEQYTPGYDCVFLKTELPFLGGLEAARKIREIDRCVEVVLLSPDTALAIAGYAVQASDYLVLPLRYEAFERALRKSLRKAKEKKDTDVLIKCKSVYYRVPARELLFVEVRGHYLVYHLLDGEITALGQLNAIEAQLAARGFFRCSVGYMVNMRYVERFTRSAVCVNGQELPISRSKKEELFGCLGVAGRGKARRADAASA